MMLGKSGSLTNKISNAVIPVLAIGLIVFSCIGGSSGDERVYPEDHGREVFVDKLLDELDRKEYLDLGSFSDCLDDCSGHEAGFEWAKENAVYDASLCLGDSNSFVEGCKAYAEEADNIVSRPEGYL